MIRTYRESDRAALRKITTICFEKVCIDRNIEDHFGAVGGTDWTDRKRRHIDADIADCPEGILIVEQEGKVAGYISCRLDTETRIGHIANLAVLPACQGRGLGRQLMLAALELMKARGMELARIETLEQNDVGSNFYPKMGFVEVARQIHYAMPLV
ncbi:MAG: GNAT family N-acetyltransferase [Candidatus Latescibacterota bacterium]